VPTTPPRQLALLTAGDVSGFGAAASPNFCCAAAGRGGADEAARVGSADFRHVLVADRAIAS